MTYGRNCKNEKVTITGSRAEAVGAAKATTKIVRSDSGDTAGGTLLGFDATSAFSSRGRWVWRRRDRNPDQTHVAAGSSTWGV